MKVFHGDPDVLNNGDEPIQVGPQASKRVAARAAEGVEGLRGNQWLPVSQLPLRALPCVVCPNVVCGQRNWHRLSAADVIVGKRSSHHMEQVPEYPS
ncbi:MULTISPECIES: hypothetical protein [unclassified Nocardia]|uniref:hypothetical protein n=1 Tax=unclassified Nocardia TaxID=2637762 RepID=UPI0024A96C4A|nr:MULTISPECIES: hypothetical protein [unclassified Nocardia]